MTMGRLLEFDGRGRRVGWAVTSCAALVVVVSLAVAFAPRSVPAVPAPVANPSRSATPANVPSLIGTAWRVERLYDSPIIPTSRITLQFGNISISGTTSCAESGRTDVVSKKISGSYRQDAGLFTISAQVTAVGRCPDDASRQEGTFAAALGLVDHFAMDGENLALLDDHDTVLVELVPLVAGTSWTLSGRSGKWAGPDPGLTLRVQDGRVSGWSGCGDYEGALVRDGDRWSVSKLRILSPIPCPSTASEHMQRFLGLLEKVTSATRDAGLLTLHAPDGDLVFTAGTR